MGGAIKAIFSPPKPQPTDTSAQDRQLAQIAADKKEEERKLDARKKTIASLQGRGGRKTLFDTETGVEGKEKLGA